MDFMWFVIILIILGFCTNALNRQHKAAIRRRDQELYIKEMETSAKLIEQMSLMVNAGMDLQSVAVLLPAPIRAEFLNAQKDARALPPADTEP